MKGSNSLVESGMQSQRKPVDTHSPQGRDLDAFTQYDTKRNAADTHASGAPSGIRVKLSDLHQDFVVIFAVSPIVAAVSQNRLHEGSRLAGVSG